MKKVRAMFPVDEQDAVMGLRDEHDGVRVQLALVKLSEGDGDRLSAWMDEARKDWRDVLAAAEYLRQSGCSGPAPPEVIAADRADYLEWLEGESPA